MNNLEALRNKFGYLKANRYKEFYGNGYGVSIVPDLSQRNAADRSSCNSQRSFRDKRGE